MNIPRLILRKLRTECMGRTNAIKRRDLLSYLQAMGAVLTDREMRAIIEGYPKICSGSEGYFIARTAEEVEYSILYIKKKAMSLLRKMRLRREAYPQFYREHQEDLPFPDGNF